MAEAAGARSQCAHSIGVVVSDLAKSVDFYTKIIGMKKTGGFSVNADMGKRTGLTDGQPVTITVLKLGESKTATEWKLMETLWPTVQRAVKSHWMLQGANDVRKVIEETLDGVRHPVIVLRDDGRVDFMNAAAAALHRSWLQLSHQRLVRIGQVALDATGPASVATLAARGTPLVVDNVIAQRYRRGTAVFSPIRDLPAYATTWPQASTLLVLDLDDLKRVNDSRGHAAGFAQVGEAMTQMDQAVQIQQKMKLFWLLPNRTMFLFSY